MVERDPLKIGVAGSSPVRSTVRSWCKGCIFGFEPKGLRVRFLPSALGRRVFLGKETVCKTAPSGCGFESHWRHGIFFVNGFITGGLMKLRFLLIAMLLVTMLGTLGIGSNTGFAQATSIAVTQDAYIAQGTPTQNFGSNTRLRVDANSGSNDAMKSHVEFASACPVTACVFHFYSDNAYGGTLNFSFNQSAFDESTLTWNNAPTDASGLSQLGGTAAGWSAVSVPQGTVRMVIEGSSTTQFPFYSSEAGANLPYMDYAAAPTATNTAVPPTATNTAIPPTATNTNTPVPPTATNTNTPVPPTATNTVAPPTPTATTYWFPTGIEDYPSVADSTVNSAQPTTNFGTQQTLRAVTATSGTQETYIMFGDNSGDADCYSPFSGPTEVKLRLYNNNTVANGNLTFTLAGWGSPAFDENTITWNNKPTVQSIFVVTIPAPTTVGYFTVTFPPSGSNDGDFLDLELSCTANVKITSSGNTSPQLFSRQYGGADQRPHLLVDQVCGGGSCGGTPTATTVPTNTPVPPTATNTAIPPTATATPNPTATATATPSGSSTSFWAVGDIMDDTTPNTGKWVNADRVGQLVDTNETVVTLGDHQYEDGTLAEFNTYFDVSTWGDLKDAGVLRPAVGNHEYHTSGASGYYTYFGAAAHGPNGYYTFTQGGVTFIVINTNCSKVTGGCTTTGAQGQMITAAMQNNNGCTVLAGHHPAYTSSPRDDGAGARPLFQLFDSLGGDIALYGHEHSYERFVPIDGAGAPTTGGVQLMVIGTGGKRGGTFDVVEQGSAVRITGVDGAVHFTVNGNNYSYEFIDIDGAVRDSGSGTCQ